MNKGRLRRLQESMRSKQPTRPWSKVKRKQARASVLRLRRMFEVGLTDSRIAEVTGMTEKAVSFLRGFYSQ